MDLLRDLLKALLILIAASGATFALLLHSAAEQQIPDLPPGDEACPAPDGWSAHLVQVGESLTILADIVGAAPAEIVIANCLQGDVHPGDTIFLPPPILSKSACGPPTSWVLYEIQSGDSLPRLATQFGVSEAAIWHANCISEDMTFQPGFRIYLPSVKENP